MRTTTRARTAAARRRAAAHRRARPTQRNRRRAPTGRRSGRRRARCEPRMTALATVGVFGGSGFYALLDDVEEVEVDTPYGPPSDRLFVGEVDGTRVAFLP